MTGKGIILTEKGLIGKCHVDGKEDEGMGLRHLLASIMYNLEAGGV